MPLAGLPPELPDIAPPPKRDPLAPPAPSAAERDAAVMSGGPGVDPKPMAPTILIPEEASRLVMLSDMDRERSHRVRWPRLQTNRKNWNFFHMQQDWSAKIDGQSRLFLPDLPMSIYQVAATIENQLVNFQNWFGIESMGGLSVFDPDTMRLLVQHCLNRLWKPGDEVETSLKFPAFLADSIIVGLIESEITWKIFGVDSERITYMLESVADPEAGEGELLDEMKEFDDEVVPPPRSYERMTQQIRKAFIRTFRLGIDLIPFEDSFPDPSALNRFHIHEVTRHVSELRNNPDYDPVAVAQIANYVSSLEADRDKAIRAGTPTGRLLGDDPNQVRVREFWGDVVDPSTGKYKYRNSLMTTCCGKLLRPPTPNPMWHQYRPIVRAPILRTPLAPVHKALVDHAVPSAEAENEMASLMVDGALSSVWGTRQARPELLADPTSISKGIPPSFTAVLKRGAPANAKFLERVDEGTSTPQYGMDMLLRLGRGREVGMATPSFQNGAVPPRQTLATEVVEASNSSDNLFENVSTHLEQGLIEPSLQLIWLTMWQGLDDFSAPELVQVLGPERAVLLQSLTPEERFYLFANNVKFDVRGLRNLLQGINDFRKLTTVTQMIAGSPILMQSFVQQYDPARILEKAVRAVNLDPTELEWRASDTQRRMQLLMSLQAMPKPGGGQGGAGMGQGSPFNPPGMLPSPGESNVEGEFAPPNPMGFQGTQV
jgi:hypothetical protein